MSTAKKPGLYANIHAKQERIAEGSGEKMRRAGSAGAPSATSFKAAAKTTKAAKAKKAAKATKTSRARPKAAKKSAARRA
ncbi:MAG: hypothetical protein ABIQ33_00170 [Caldimonas sp.]